jgi:hypothetical protein
MSALPAASAFHFSFVLLPVWVGKDTKAIKFSIEHDDDDIKINFSTSETCYFFGV